MQTRSANLVGAVGAEDTLAMQLKAVGIDCVRQHLYVPGRKFRADFCLPERRILVACDGGVYNRRAHGSVSGILADIARQNFASINGYFVIRVTPQMVNDGTALKLIEGILETPWRITSVQ